MNNTEEMCPDRDNNPKDAIFDSLNRTNFVNQIIDIIEKLSAKKLSKCYAIKGAWGVGKSRILDMIESELFNQNRNVTADEKYILLRYNAWEYDYYEEPLIAIIASMIDELDRTFCLVSNKHRATLSGCLKLIGSGLLTAGIKHIKSKTGFDANILKEYLTEGKKLSDEEIKNNNLFDSELQLKKAVSKIKEEITNVSKEVTIILIVDELDRCLPEYAIKVLERLHHIFYNTPNTQVILSVDYNQLENTVQSIYGETVSTRQYLSKFIDFGIQLDEGHITDNFDKQFDYYVSNFDFQHSVSSENDLNEFKSHILDGIDMRTRIEIINKANLLHEILNGTDIIIDYSYMCIEVVLTILKTFDIDIEKLNFPYLFEYIENAIPLGLKFLETIYVEAKRPIFYPDEHLDISNKYLVKNGNDTMLTISDIWGAVLSGIRNNMKNAKDNIMGEYNISSKNIIAYSKEFWNLLQIIN